MKRGISYQNCSSHYAGGGVPYGPNSIRRAEASDRSGGFCSPYDSQNLSGLNWLPALPGKKSPVSNETGDFLSKFVRPNTPSGY